MQIKPGVRVHGLRPEIVLAVLAAESAWRDAGAECVVTSVIDGKHSQGSLHYAGAAVDIRTRNLAEPALSRAINKLRESLGEDFDVVFEKDHVHVEFQPKKPY
jgi:hypothetical protein